MAISGLTGTEITDAVDSVSWLLALQQHGIVPPDLESRLQDFRRVLVAEQQSRQTDEPPAQWSKFG